jgi:predicted MFS family arabinose efflux permease
VSERADTAFVGILGFAGLISAADNWIVAPILPSIAGGLRVSIAQAAGVLTAYMIPYGIMQPVHGYWSERWGKAWLLVRLAAGLALGTAGCALARSFLWLCGFRFVTGFFAAGIIAVSLALIGDRVRPARRQACVGRFMGIVFLGQGASAGLGGWLAGHAGWRAVFLLFAAAAASVAVLLRRLPCDRPTHAPPGFAAEVKRALAARRGRIIYSLALATGFLLLGIYSFEGAFLQHSAGLDSFEAGSVLMFFGLACLAGGASMGWISARLGKKGTVLAGGALGFCAATLLAFSPGWRTGWLATVALGLGYILIQSTLATQAFDLGSNGLSSALVGLGLFGGGGLSTALGGIILAHGGYQTLWIAFAAGTAALVALVAVFLAR